MKTSKRVDTNHKQLINNLVSLLEKGNAHASLDDALKGITFSVLGKTPGKLPYTIWQLAEHIRIAQWDILEFSRNAGHVSPKWPEEYWPIEKAPESKAAWQKCIKSIRADRREFIELIKNSEKNLYEYFEYGNGQNLLKEALVVADHNSYHAGELIVMRRLLNAWKK
ncbi:MAG: DinB family protein [Ginsengibacter sp.]